MHPAGLFAVDAFARLAIELHDAPGREQTVEAVVQFAVQAENCAYAGIALAVRGGRAEIAAVTDPLIESIYQLQRQATPRASFGLDLDRACQTRHR